MTDQQFEANRSGLKVGQQRLFNFVKRQIQREIRGEACEPIRLIVMGSAGTGKSFILKLITEEIKRGYKIVNPNSTSVKVCAYTGVAALLINGQTIHSVFKLPVQRDRKIPTYKPLTGIWLEKLRQIWKFVRFLIIDEMSMLPYELLWQINLRLQELKGNTELFGGVNVLFFGDLMQLPPVVGSPIFIQPEKMDGSIHLFREFSFCELTEVVRQQGDHIFIDLLNNLREGNLSDEQYDLLVRKQENSKQEGPFQIGKALRIFPTNKMVAQHNELVMSSADSIEKFTVIAQDRLVEHDKRQITVPMELIVLDDINKTAGVPKTLTLYKGLRIMLRYNVSLSLGLVNGSIGSIRDIQFAGWRRRQLYDEDIPRVQVDFDNNIGTHWIEPMTVTFDGKLGFGSAERRMLPMVPCFACTVHKLQGSTIEQAVVNLGSEHFAPGQKFVALSRCKTLERIEIDEIHPDGLISGVVCDEEALEELQRLRSLPDYDDENNDD